MALAAVRGIDLEDLDEQAVELERSACGLAFVWNCACSPVRPDGDETRDLVVPVVDAVVDRCSEGRPDPGVISGLPTRSNDCG